MRTVEAATIRETVARLCQEANYNLPEDVVSALRAARQQEESLAAQRVLDTILENAQIAATKGLPLCQDTGTTVVFLDIGQDIHIIGDLHKALHDGVAQGYKTGFLRSSMVKEPFSRRLNTGDNAPPVVHTEVVPGDRLKVTVMPKGAGCENMSRMEILLPGAGKKGIADLLIDTVERSGGNPCPPIIVGMGIGGTAEHCMYLAKRALLRTVGAPNPDPQVAQFERELLGRVNATGIGPQAWGGRTTALAVHIETYPTHIASLPVGINIQCHSARFKTAVI